MRMMIAAATVLMAGGCVTARPGTENIQLLSNPDLVKGCTFLAQESVSSSSLPLDYVRESVIAQIKGAALDRGGTHVLTPGPVIAMPGPSATLNGDIYACK